MSLVQKIFESRGFVFRRDFTEDTYKRVMSGEVVRIEDKNGDNPIFIQKKTANGESGILITTWNAHISICMTIAEKGYKDVMLFYDMNVKTA